MKTFLVVLTLCCAALGQNQYYVSTTGSDSNNGTSSGTAWRTINHADSALAVGTGAAFSNSYISLSNIGTVVHVAAGTYSGGTISCGFTAFTCSSHSGTSGNQILFVSDTLGGAHIVGPASAVEQFAWVVSGSWINVVGFDITSISYRGIFTTGSHIGIYKLNVHNIGQSFCPGDGGAGISTQTTSTFITIEANLVHDVGPYPNTVGCNATHGIYIGGPNAIVRNNIVYHASTNGIELFHDPQNEIIANNLVFSNGAPCCGGGIQDGGVSSGFTATKNDAIINNISVNNGGWAFDLRGLDSTSIFKNNIYFGNGGSCSNCSGPSASGNLTSGTSANLFINYQANGSGDYHPNSSSASVNAATTVCAPSGVSPCAPSTDFDGLARPQGFADDIGPYEFVTSTTVQKPSPPTGLTAIVH